MFWRFVFPALVCHAALCVGMAMDHKGRVKMGVKSDLCDDAHVNITLDWDPDDPGAKDVYTCINRDGRDDLPEAEGDAEDCLTEEEMKKPEFALDHECMDTPIEYTDNPPRSGAHRPLWPRYGEYTFCPKQRWVHSLEHGAAVFLYHPCAPKEEIENFKTIARDCLHRRIVTAYKELPNDKNFAIVTLGCRLMMSHVNKAAAQGYLIKHAIVDGEEATHKDGQYDIGLVQASMTSKKGDPDKVICPEPEQTNKGGQNDERGSARTQEVRGTT